MPKTTADVVICGAGIAGISAAYHLAVRHGLRDVLLVDERPPLSLTSDKSTECYRNWWPGPGDAMVRLMNRSIDLLESLAAESGNRFHLNRSGYLYVTMDPQRAAAWGRSATEISRLGAGPLRLDVPPAGEQAGADGADLITEASRIRRDYPYLAKDVRAVLAARRCGWLSAQQLGMYLLQQAQAAGARLLTGRLDGIATRGGRVSSVSILGADGAAKVDTPAVVNAAGPFFGKLGSMIGLDLPVEWEIHRKIAFNDPLGVVPRQAPLIIGADPQVLEWSEEERAALAETSETRPLLERLPSGVHIRPEGGAQSQTVLLLWPYHPQRQPPTFPIPDDPHYLEIALRGMARILPGLSAYLTRLPRGVQDAGYYTRTRENRPLIGRTPVPGYYLIGALSGFGIMASQAAGELLAAALCAGPLPDYAGWFELRRYEDPDYRRLLETWDDEGQL
jgi:glycine/D-amino acid oxidase-like deaminating enzyme